MFSIERVIGTQYADTLSIAANGADLFDSVEWIDLGEHNGVTEEEGRAIDAVILSDVGTAAFADLRDRADQSVTIGPRTLNLRNTEGIVGTDFDDTFYGVTDGDHRGTGSEILGGKGDDTIIGGDARDRFAGGEDSDWVNGGDGHDILYGGDKDAIEDSAADDLFGGEGADLFYVGAGDTVHDPDEANERIYWSETDYFTGGIREKGDPPNVYKGDDGTTYTYQASGPNAGGLTITRPDGAHYYVQNFVNGEASINLTEKPDEDDPVDAEKYLSPLVLDLAGDGIAVTRLATQSVHFDFEGDGFRELTAWISPADGFLALDRNGNGSIDDAPSCSVPILQTPRNCRPTAECPACSSSTAISTSRSPPPIWRLPTFACGGTSTATASPMRESS